MKNPVLISGMYRSGGCMVAAILNQSGIFTGLQTEGFSQPEIFGHLNHWLLEQTGATWDNPYNYRFITGEMEERVAKVFARKINGKHLRRFLGKSFPGVRKYENIDFDWGWYHPINTFTAGVWQRLFADPKIIHVYRNPVDVAASLRNYNLAEQKMFKKRFFSGIRRRRLENKLTCQRIYYHSVRTLQLEEGFKLWVDYLEAANNLESNGKIAVYHLCYEDLIGNFEAEIVKLMDFLNFKLPDGMTRELYQIINPGRRYAFLNDKNLTEFYFTIRNRAEVVEMNYHQIGS
jgi:hypothetical protein